MTYTNIVFELDDPEEELPDTFPYISEGGLLLPIQVGHQVTCYNKDTRTNTLWKVIDVIWDVQYTTSPMPYQSVMQRIVIERVALEN